MVDRAVANESLSKSTKPPIKYNAEALDRRLYKLRQLRFEYQFSTFSWFPDFTIKETRDFLKHIQR
jgi:hypothetical protein